MGILGAMVSERDKKMMELIGRDLSSSETHDRGTPRQRETTLDFINADRGRFGEQPMVDRAPEEGFYERARSLGMGRIDR